MAVQHDGREIFRFLEYHLGKLNLQPLFSAVLEAGFLASVC